MADVVRQQPYVEQFMSFIGASGSSTVANNGRIFIRLKPRTERRPVEELIADLRPKLAAVPGIRVYPQVLPTIRIGGQLTKAVYQYTLQDADLQELYQWAPQLYDRLRQLPGLQDVNTDLQITSPQIVVDIDRDKASALGVTADQIESALGAAYGSQAGLHHLHADQPVPGHPGGRPPSTSRTRARWRGCTCARAAAGWCRSTRSPR